LTKPNPKHSVEIAKPLANPYNNVVDPAMKMARVKPLRTLIMVYNLEIKGFSGNLMNRFADRSMPTSTSEANPTSFQWIGNTMYSIESPNKETAVIRAISMTGL
jgi:hypothetical protein